VVLALEEDEARFTRHSPRGIDSHAGSEVKAEAQAVSAPGATLR
jgi:hypothetical protein